ncbi:hypothetical protein PYJP_17420 [Pyrofollis japonicus]|nr:hypothetical protein PYJP_17420 [Pyrofollis japonicus]
MKPVPLAIVIAVSLIVIALAALAPLSCEAGNLPLQPPSRSHPLGTDPVGRDALCLVAKGAEASIEAGLAALLVAVAVLVGSMFAAAHALVAGIVDALAALVAGLPRMSLLLLLALFARLPPWGIGVLVGFLVSMQGARAVAARARQVAAMPYVEAARAIGASRARIVLRHIAPNAWASAASYASIAATAAVYSEAGFSMLGLGDPSEPSWGLMIGLVLSTPGALLTEAGLIQVLVALALVAVTAALLHAGIERSGEDFETIRG